MVDCMGRVTGLRSRWRRSLNLDISASNAVHRTGQQDARPACTWCTCLYHVNTLPQLAHIRWPGQLSCQQMQFDTPPRLAHVCRRCCTALTWTAARLAPASPAPRRWAAGERTWALGGPWVAAVHSRGEGKAPVPVLASQRSCLPPPVRSPASPACSPDSAYSRHPWNLSVMPRQGGRYSSLLRVLDGNIAGGRWPCAAC